METIGKKHSAIVMCKVINNKAPGYLINLKKKKKKATVVMRYVRVKVDFSS